MPKFFYKDIELDVKGAVYEPREDSLLTAETLEKNLRKGMKVLDIGTGTGFLAILAAKRGCDVTAVDIDDEAFRIAKENVKKNDVFVKVLKSNLLDSVRGKFDLIVFNAPYLPEKWSKESASWAAGEGLQIIERTIIQAKRSLAPGGKILVCVSTATGIDRFERILDANKLTFAVVAQRKVPCDTLLVYSAQLL